MPIENLGFLVSGETDKLALPELAKKHLQSARINALTTNGPLKRKIVKYLRIFQYDGSPYDRVIVIEDSDGQDPILKRTQLMNEVGSQTFAFEVRYFVIVQELETWLLADESALTTVSHGRGGNAISRISGTLESLSSPKERLIKTLQRAGAGPYVPETARLIAHHTNPETVRYRCSLYQEFQKLLT